MTERKHNMAFGIDFVSFPVFALHIEIECFMHNKAHLGKSIETCKKFIEDFH